MPKDNDPNENKALHQLMEDEFQRLVDIIEQKNIAHESVHLSPPAEDDPLLITAQRLQDHSEALGAESLAEFFYALEGSARSGDVAATHKLLSDIGDEFESVKRILGDDDSTV